MDWEGITSQATRVCIVADIRLYREGLAALLDREPTLSVAATAAGPNEAVSFADSVAFDVALIDMAMPGAVATARALARRSPATSIVALAMPDSESQVIACAEAG